MDVLGSFFSNLAREVDQISQGGKAYFKLERNCLDFK
jgi:hypothetical protein